MFIVIVVSAVLVITCVGIHYFALVNLSQLRSATTPHPRRRLNVMVIGAIIAHVVELSCFAVGYYLIDLLNGPGGLMDANGQSSADYGYFSFVAYTSLGFGDITPQGPVRFMTALETLTGLILIAWTSSFIFLQMQSTWNQGQQGEDVSNDLC